MSTKLPTLFKKTSTGASQEWTIKVEGNTIVTVWGQCGGAMQTTKDVIKEGKNIGKVNATTAETQAVSEANSQWEKKLKKGYVQNLSDAKLGIVDDVIEGGIFPMLAHKFNEQSGKIKFPAYVQPKFDGHRCIAVVENQVCTLWSRTRKPITGLPHINKQIEAFVKANNIKDIMFDGELYNHAYKAKFEELTSFIRNEDPKPGHEIVQYHIYDLAMKGSQRVRFDLLKSFDLKDNLVKVETHLLNDEDDLMTHFQKYLAAGYEGLMVRNEKGEYVNKRSYDLQKVKTMDDAEFKIIGIEEGRGKLVGHAIFICKTASGTEFRAKMKGATSELKRYFDNPSLAVGKELTVQYQGFTNKTDVPRFAVGVRIKANM